MSKVLRVCTLSILLAATGCVSDPLPFAPLSEQQQERQLAGEIKYPPTPAYPTTMQSQFAPYAPPPNAAATRPATGPSLADAQVVPMTLADLIKASVANSHTVKVAGYDPAIAETRIIEAQANFDPAFFINTQYQRQDIPTGGELITLPSNPFATPPPIFTTSKTRTFQFQSGIQQNLASGGQASISYQSQLTDLDPQTTQINPLYTSQIALDLTQPLLRNFGADVNGARIVLERNNTKVSVLDYRLALEKNIFQIEQGYWQLVQAQSDVEADEELLRQTEHTANIEANRYTQDATREGISQTITAVNQRRALLVRAKAKMADLSDQLKRMINDPDLPVSSALLIIPATPPALEQIQFDLNDQIRTAMDCRPELAQQQYKIENAGTILNVARNNLLPQLDLKTELSFIGGDASFNDALDNQLDWGHINYSAQLQLQVPIGNRAAKAIYRRSLLQREQAIETYRDTESQVVADVKMALRDVQTSWDEIVSNRRAVFAAEDALSANLARQASNQPLTPEFLQLQLDRQADVANTKLAYDQSVANYETALAKLEQVKGTLLRYDNIVLQEDRWPGGMRVRVK